MKIIHNHINEYEHYEDLVTDFKNMPSEMKKNGVMLHNSKKKAEKDLKYQHDKFKHLGARIFWWDKGDFEGTTYYNIYECLYD